MISLLMKYNKTTGVTKTTQTWIYNIISHINKHSLLLGEIRFQLTLQVCSRLCKHHPSESTFVLAGECVTCGFLNSRFSHFEDVHWEKFPQNTNSSMIFSYLLQCWPYYQGRESGRFWGVRNNFCFAYKLYSMIIPFWLHTVSFCQ